MVMWEQKVQQFNNKGQVLKAKNDKQITETLSHIKNLSSPNDIEMQIEREREILAKESKLNEDSSASDPNLSGVRIGDSPDRTTAGNY